MTGIERQRARAGRLFVLPATVHLVVFALAPFLFSLWIALRDWQVLRGESPFVGLAQFQRLGGDGAFWGSVGKTAVYAGMSVPVGMALALGVALLVAQPLRGMATFRTLFYIPAVSSGVAISILWIYIYLPDRGLINALLGGTGIDFLNDPQLALPALAFMSLWVGLGPRMIVYVAGLLALPTSVMEAAELDGAGPSRRFWAVTFPLLAPTHFFVLVTSTIAAFQTFTPVYTMTQGRPMGATDLVGFHIYETAWRSFDVSYAAAQSFVLLVILGVLSVVQIRLMRGSLEASGAG